MNKTNQHDNKSEINDKKMNDNQNTIQLGCWVIIIMNTEFQQYINFSAWGLHQLVQCHKS